MIELIALPLIAGVALALLTGPLGCFIIWRKMSYFGDTLAHSSLLGVTLGLLLQLNPHIAIIGISIAISVSLLALEKNSSLSTDALLGILSHGSLAAGLVLIGLFPQNTVNLNSYLVGDILTVDGHFLSILIPISATILGLIILSWKKLLLITVDFDLAQVENKHAEKYKLLLVILTAVTIAISIQVIGLLLITAMMVVPASAAKFLCRSPEAMAILATLIGILSVALGMLGSFSFDTPTGPTIVLTAILFFILPLTYTKIIPTTSVKRSSNR